MVTKLQLRPSKRFLFAAVILLAGLVLVLLGVSIYRTYSGSEYALRKRVEEIQREYESRGPNKEMFANETEQIFAQAIVDGDLGTVRKMVADGMDVNVRGKYDITPLYFAIHYQKKEIFSYLLQQGADSTVEMEYAPADGRKYRLLAPMTLWVALNDLDPDYFVEIMKYPVSITNDTLWESFCDLGIFRAGTFRSDGSRRTHEERVKIDLAKLEAIFAAGFTMPAERSAHCVSDCLWQHRFDVVLVFLEKGWGIDERFLRTYHNYLSKSYSSPGFVKITNYLTAADPDFLTGLNAIFEMPPDGEKTVCGEVFPVFSQRDKALQNLAEKLNAQRGIAPQ